MTTRNELEVRITEAVDGLLNDTEVRALREQLQAHPDLLAEWEAQSSTSVFKQMYQEVHPSPFALTRLRQKMYASTAQPWEVELLFIFKRYVLALGILAIAFVGAMNMLQPKDAMLSTDDLVLSEMNTFFNSLEQEAQLWTTIDETP